MAHMETFLGIDVGISGIRVVTIDAMGVLVGKAEQLLESNSLQGLIHEQDPASWWHLICTLVQQVNGKLSEKLDAYETRAVSVTSTSGTLVLAYETGSVVRPAMMYDDSRSTAEADHLNDCFENGSHHWNCSNSLCKALWVQNYEESVWCTVRYILSPADWLLSRLTGNYGISDYSNSLKLGYDFDLRTWLPAVRASGIPGDLLPSVVAPATCIGKIFPQAASATQLPQTCSMVTGATDGLASLIASGAKTPGDANTTWAPRLSGRLLQLISLRPAKVSTLIVTPWGSGHLVPPVVQVLVRS